MYCEILKIEVETLRERKRCFEKRCKGNTFFLNYQIIWTGIIWILWIF